MAAWAWFVAHRSAPASAVMALISDVGGTGGMALLAAAGAALLDLSDLGDCQVIWEAANLVGVGSYDFFLSDPAGREVYLLHHHDKPVTAGPTRSASGASAESA